MYIALRRERWHSATWLCCSRESSRRKSTIKGFSAVDKVKSSYTAVKFNCSIWTRALTCRYLSCRQNSTRTASNLRCLTIPPPVVSFLISFLAISIDKRATRLLTRTTFYFLIQTSMATSITTTIWPYHQTRVLTCHRHIDPLAPIEGHNSMLSSSVTRSILDQRHKNGKFFHTDSSQKKN